MSELSVGVQVRIRASSQDRPGRVGTIVEYWMAYDDDGHPWKVLFEDGYLEWYGAYELELPREAESGLGSHGASTIEFQKAMLQRLDAGEKEYGTRNFDNSVLHSIKDMKEEAIDFANYAAMLYHKLCVLEEFLKKQVGG